MPRSASRRSFGHPIEPGLLTDAAGNPTTDPRALGNGGLMLPTGGYKGFGLAMVVDCLAGVLTGAGFALTGGITHGQSGHFFWALNIEAYMPLHQFLTRVDEQLDQIKRSRRAPRRQRNPGTRRAQPTAPAPALPQRQGATADRQLERARPPLRRLRCTRPTPRALAATSPRPVASPSRG